MTETGGGAFDKLLCGCDHGPVRSQAAAHRRPTPSSHGEREASAVGRVDSLRQIDEGIGVGAEAHQDAVAGLALIAGNGMEAAEEGVPWAVALPGLGRLR